MRKNSLVTNSAVTAKSIAKNIFDGSGFEFYPDVEDVVLEIRAADDGDINEVLKGSALNAHAHAQTILEQASLLPTNQRTALIHTANALNKQMIQCMKLMQGYAPIRRQAKIGYQF